MPHARSGAIVLAALFTGVLAVTPVFAQDAGPPKSSRALDSRRGVEVTVIAGSQDAQALVDAIREVVGRLGLPITSRIVQEASDAPASPPMQGLARVEINLTSPAGDQVDVFGKDGQLALSRRFVRDASGSVLREEMADAVRSAVEAQLLTDPERRKAEVERRGGRATAGSDDIAPTAGLPPIVAEPPVAEPPAPPPPLPAAPVEPPPGEAPATPVASPQGLALDLTAFGGVGGFAWTTTSVVSHVGGQAALALRKWRNLSVTVSGEYLPPFDAGFTAGPVTAQATTSAASLRIGPAVQVFRARNVAIDAGVGAGIDVINVTLSHAQEKYTPTAQTIMDPILRGLATANVALAPRVVLTLALAYDWDVAIPFPRYTLPDKPANDKAVLAPWRTRPLALVGLTFAALGDARFASGIFR